MLCSKRKETVETENDSLYNEKGIRKKGDELREYWKEEKT